MLFQLNNNNVDADNGNHQATIVESTSIENQLIINEPISSNISLIIMISLLILFLLLLLHMVMAKIFKFNYRFKSLLLFRKYFHISNVTTSNSNNSSRDDTSFCWCCLKNGKRNGGKSSSSLLNSNILTSNKERISKELVKSFSFNENENNLNDLYLNTPMMMNNDDDDDENEDHMIGDNHMILSNDPNDEYEGIDDDDGDPTTVNDLMMIQSSNRMKSMNNHHHNNSRHDDYYLISKLNECLSETNHWFDLRQQQQQEDIGYNENERLIRQHQRQQPRISSLSLSSATSHSTSTTLSSCGNRFQRQQSVCSANDDPNDQNLYNHRNSITNTANNNNSRARNLLKQQAIYTSIALKNNTKAFEMYLMNDDTKLCLKNNNQTTNNDLISLAEKGKIGKQTSTDGSISSDNGNNNNEDAIIALANNHNHNNNRNSNSNKRKLLKYCLRNNISNETTDSTNSQLSTTAAANMQQNNNKYQSLQNYYDLNCDESDTSGTQSSNLPNDYSPNSTLNRDDNTNGNNAMKNGRLEISFAYDAPSKKLYVTVIQVDDLPPHRDNNMMMQQQHQSPQQQTNNSQIYVKIVLSTTNSMNPATNNSTNNMNMKKQKYRTKMKPIYCPIFDETFIFNRINPNEIQNLYLYFRLFSIGFTRKNYLLGECQLSFAMIRPQQQETKLWFTLEMPIKRNRLLDIETSSLARTDSLSSHSLQMTSSPELLLSLAYNGTTGRLTVTMIKGSQFRSLSTRTPDTYIKILLVSQSGNEMARGKTHVCRAQPNPLFRETFVFQVALFQLPDVTLMIFVYNKRSIKRKELIGWISLGYNSSGDEELSHWNDMRDNKGEQVPRWHVLHEP